MIHYNLSAFSISIILSMIWILVLVLNKKLNSKNLKISLNIALILIMIAIPIINYKFPIDSKKQVYSLKESVKEYDYKLIGKQGSDLYIEQDGKVIKYKLSQVSKTDKNKVKIAYPEVEVNDSILKKEKTNLFINKFIINPENNDRVLTDNFKARLHSFNAVYNYVQELEIKDSDLKEAKDLTKDDLSKLKIFIEQ